MRRSGRPAAQVAADVLPDFPLPVICSQLLPCVLALDGSPGLPFTAGRACRPGWRVSVGDERWCRGDVSAV